MHRAGLQALGASGKNMRTLEELASSHQTSRVYRLRSGPRSMYSFFGTCAALRDHQVLMRRCVMGQGIFGCASLTDAHVQWDADLGNFMHKRVQIGGSVQILARNAARR